MSYRESEGFFSRRSFLATGGGAVAAAAMTKPSSLFAAPVPDAAAKRIALVGALFPVSAPVLGVGHG